MKYFSHTFYIFLVSLATLLSCGPDDSSDLPPVEERVSAAIAELKSELTAPANGWRLEYQPTPESGNFLILLNFDDNGNVTIKSDLPDNNGEFYESTITYRIDNALGLELILETYAVFHYLFEYNQATFGAEFEFLYKGKEGENLLFESLSDRGAKTQLVFEPAGSNDEASFARTIASNLNNFSVPMPQIFGGIAPMQELVLENRNITVYWTMDPVRRNIFIDLAGVGITLDEVIANDRIISIGHQSGFILEDGKLILLTPLTFTLDGSRILLEEINLNDFGPTGPGFCSLSSENTNKYTGSIANIGPISLQSSYINSSGAGFRPQNVYTVNVFFVFDGQGNSLSEAGTIAEKFPDASGFIFIYNANLNDPEIPGNSVGLILSDGNLALRAFEPTSTDINRISLTLTDSLYFSGQEGPQDAQNLITLTNEIFEGGDVYSFFLDGQGVPVYRLFNPCNGYELFLL